MIETTNKQSHELKPNSPEWHKHREGCFNASEAPAMMNCSPYTSRSELLKAKATGEAKEITRHQQSIFDQGHAFEALARPFAEDILLTDLFEKTMSATVNGLLLSASYDGLCMAEVTSFEHKMLNKSNIQNMKEGIIAKHYRIQMEQQLMISGGEKVLFMVSNGMREGMLHMDYHADIELRQDIIDGWQQFKNDLENYVAPEIVVAPIVPDLMQLPTLNIKIYGGITDSNIEVFKNDANKFIENINTKLSTDTDFAIAEKTVKFLKATRDKIKHVKKAALSQTVDIEKLFNELDFLDSQFQTQQSRLDKLVKAEKENKKNNLCNDASATLREFVLTANHRLNRPCIAVTADFRVAIKGKRTISSMENAIDAMLAQSKIDVTKREKVISVNLDYYRTAAKEYEFLFLDLNQLFDKDAETFTFLIDSRIEEHAAKEKIRLDAERVKLQKELDDKAAQKVIDDKAKEANRDETAKQKVIDDKAKADNENRLCRTLNDKVNSLATHATSQPKKQLDSLPVKRKPSIEQVANLLAIKFCHKHGLGQNEIMDLMGMIRKGYEDLNNG